MSIVGIKDESKNEKQKGSVDKLSLRVSGSPEVSDMPLISGPEHDHGAYERKSFNRPSEFATKK